ncbi:hypothetical protein HMI01_13140 [Halolactibacillus miurensis]|uniref:Nucleotidyltransferase-like n=2 Tax=Halolactibacillus TaxID=306539 RepID=A0A1I6T676_9BACI|nr:nucleotidyltransferase-like protein [Halolactibacillus miurensis]GEM04326.1 hypothetical protein HMI01_13140 [Halolactibacillus miurensis]SFS84751.1 Nucleotidyltransferase-like [Halolactibacillus miurensis]
MFGELRSLYQAYTGDDDTVGVIQVDKTSRQSPNTDGFDTILLVVKEADEKIWSVKHYQIEDATVALHLVSSKRLEEWIKFSTYRRMIQWISKGKVLFDRNEFLNELKQELDRFPEELRSVKLTQEYAKAIRMFKEAVQLYDTDEELDCFNKVLRTLHSIGRLSVVKEGFYPELTGWQQIKRLDSGTYKLYEELVLSHEPIKQRVELMLLAIDFTLSNKVTEASEHLISIMGDDAWKVDDLKETVRDFDYHLDLAILMAYLIEKKMIKVEEVQSKNPHVKHRYYRVNEQVRDK